MTMTVSGRDRVRVVAEGGAAADVNRGLGAKGGERATSGRDTTTTITATTTTTGLLKALALTLQQHGLLEGTEVNHDLQQFKLKGSPWWALGTNTVTQRLILLRLLDTFDKFGWRVYGTMRQRTQVNDQHKLDTWYFVRAKDWMAGSPFNGEPVASSHDLLGRPQSIGNGRT
jgi:hypothetical protein